MNLEQKIEAVLFYKNEPVEIKKLAKILNEEEKEVREALKNLTNSLNNGNRGICLIMTEAEVSLATTKDPKTFKYKGSLDLLAHLGITKVEELPEFEIFKKKITELKEDDGRE